jgi:hypothetical protein
MAVFLSEHTNMPSVREGVIWFSLATVAEVPLVVSPADFLLSARSYIVVVLFLGYE